MQWLGIFFFSLLGFGIKELALRALLAVGFGLVTTYGMFVLFDQLQAEFTEQSNGLLLVASDTFAIFSIMKLDVCFTMILSAAAAKQVIHGWNKVTDKRTGRVWQPPNKGGDL